MLSVPTDSRGLLEYAISQTKGLGSAAQEEIWETYREGWTKAVPLKLKKSLSESVQWAWKDTIERLELQQAQSQAIGFLMGHKCTLAWSQVAWKEWGEKTVSIVTKNPYMLAELPRYGFLMVEVGVRQSFGIEDLDPRRIEAAIIYALTDLTSSGSTVLTEEAFYKKCNELCPDAITLVEDATYRLNEAGKICFPGMGLISLESDNVNEKKIFGRFGGSEEETEHEF